MPKTPYIFFQNKLFGKKKNLLLTILYLFFFNMVSSAMFFQLSLFKPLGVQQGSSRNSQYRPQKTWESSGCFAFFFVMTFWSIKFVGQICRLFFFINFLSQKIDLDILSPYDYLSWYVLDFRGPNSRNFWANVHDGRFYLKSFEKFFF